MRILSVNNTSDLYGASRCMARVFSRFVEEGHEVHAVVPDHGPLVEMLRSHGIRVHIHGALSIIDRTQLRRPLGLLRFLVSVPLSAVWLALLIARLRIDLVHTNTLVMPSPALAAGLTGASHVWHVRELMGEFGTLWKPYQRIVHRLSDAIIAISLCTREQFVPVLRDKVSVIYDGLGEEASLVDELRRSAIRGQFSADVILVGVVGRIKFRRKGQEVFVQAISLLGERHPQAHFVLIGSASPHNQDQLINLERYISELRVAPRITLLGELNDPASVFAALDIAVVPSVQPEPFGCVVMEAMAVGTPVIGSNGGGIAEQIVHDDTGLLFPPGDAGSLARAMDRLLGDAGLRERLAFKARAEVKDHFTLENTYRRMLAVFEAASGKKV